MVGRFLIFSVVSFFVLALLLLFPSGSKVEAVTYKVVSGSELSCAGPDNVYNPMECDYSPVDGVCDDVEVAERCNEDPVTCVGGPPACDDDNDGVINDGCPQVGVSPEAQNCINVVNDDPDDDFYVNDGCPVVGTHAEQDPANPACALPGATASCGSAAACGQGNNSDDDGDTVVNDGCPVKGVDAEWPDCTNDVDDDGDGFVNDGCMQYDDSCIEDPTYGPYGAGLHADMRTLVTIPIHPSGDNPPDWPNDNLPRHSQFEYQVVASVPAGWGLVDGSEIPNGAYVGTVHAEVYLSLFNGDCNIPLYLDFAMFDCTTDNSEDNEIDWVAGGQNLTDGHWGDGLPAGCRKYPSYLNDLLQDQKPRLRLYGFATVDPAYPPVHLNFAVMNPGQLAAPGSQPPEASMGDSLGYPSFFVLNNPLEPEEGGGSISEFCSPMETYLESYGVTGGDGFLLADAEWRGPNHPVLIEFYELEDPGDPESAVTRRATAERCGDGIDNDGDTSVDEMCGIVRHTNPAAGSGVYDTGTHLASVYNESYRDADDDGVDNYEDECPYTVDSCANDADDDADDTAETTAGRRVNDGCPQVGDAADDVCNVADDNDGDGYVNDGCPEQGDISEGDDDDDKIDDICDNAPPCSTVPHACSDPFDKDQDCDTIDNQLDLCPCHTALECETVGGSNGNGQCDPGAELALCTEDPGDCEADPDSCDQDGDELINDGCPTYSPGGGEPEDGPDCDLDDSGVCDPSETWTCGHPRDWDGDTRVNDGCPIIGHLDTDRDFIGNDCDDNPETPDGAYVNDMVRLAICIGETDTDSDGWCDSTEELLIDDPEAKDWGALRPEYYGIDYPITAFFSPPGASPGTCSDLTWYATAGDPTGPGTCIDNDGDTLCNAGEIVDCSCNTGSDADCDGVVDVSDNCPNDPNAEQLNSDTDLIVFPPVTGDIWGDACDSDDDNDKLTDTQEWAQGSDPKNVCDPRNFDLKEDNVVNILDVLIFSGKIFNQPCFAPDDYLLCEAVCRSNQ